MAETPVTHAPSLNPKQVRLSPAQVFAMAVAHQEARRFAQATALYRAVVALVPTAVSPRLNFAQTLCAQGHFQDALAALERVRAIDPADGAALHAHAVALHSTGDFAGAALLGRRGLALMPDNLDAQNSLAHALLCQGQLAEGWRHYLARPSTRVEPNPFNRRPLPADLHGRRLLVIADQGLGDEIFFLRFVPRLKQAGAWIAYQAHSKIAGMVSRLPFLDYVSTCAAEDPPGIDALLSVGDLPYLTTNFPELDHPPSISLTVLPGLAAELSRQLAMLGPPPYIGVTWRAGVADMLDKRIPPGDLAAALSGLPGTIVSLQRQPEDGEIEGFIRALGRPVTDFGALNEDLEKMLAMLSLLDELVGVSNTNVHLRAALGRDARVFVPFPPEFRWPGDSEGSPWFSGFTLYRQQPEAAGSSWTLALQRLRHDLQSRYHPRDDR